MDSLLRRLAVVRMVCLSMGGLLGSSWSATPKEIGPGGSSASYFESLANAPQPRETPIVEAKKVLAAELSWLQSDPTGTAALTIEVVGLSHCLQFIGNELIFDFPVESSAPELVNRAHAVMERHSIPKRHLSVETDGGAEKTLAVYQQSMAGEVDGAVRVALAVLHEVYLADAGAILRITRIR